MYVRVKITPKDYGIEKLQFGRTYYLAYGGVTYGETVTFTRKRTVEMCEIVDGRKVSSHWISKGKLKQLLNSGFIHWMGELD